MSKSHVNEADLNAYVESRVAADPALAERLARYSEIDEALRAHFDPILEEPVPDRLVRTPQSRWRPMFRYAAGLLWFAIGAGGGWYLHDVQSHARAAAAEPLWAKRAAIAHVVYAPEVRHPVEVGADQEAHLVAWLSKRLGAQLRIPQLGGIGYSLVGGRLLPGDQGPAAQFMYQDGQGQRLTLYVRSNREHTHETAFRFAQDGNLRTFYWIDRGLGLALSGEVGKDELLRIATAVYQQLNP
jgi:anti-sigma factor RsiW